MFMDSPVKSSVTQTDLVSLIHIARQGLIVRWRASTEEIKRFFILLCFAKSSQKAFGRYVPRQGERWGAPDRARA